MEVDIPQLTKYQNLFMASKNKILTQWLSYNISKTILKQHNIEAEYFIQNYANGVFDYFMGVISGYVEIGSCPVMQDLLAYLKDREISADELFEICSHFRRSMVDFSYDAELNSKELFNEISYIFDKNFSSILKYYTDTIFQKLIDARAEALKAGQAKEYFLSNMSHEIRTPLNAILGFVNLLLEENISKKHRNYLDIINDSGENLLSIINDILDFSKLRSGEFTIEPKVFSLHEELSHTMELFVASAGSKDITIVSFIDPMIPHELFSDALRIKQILSNFLSNAIKFTPFGGLIKVEASFEDKVLKISVNDNGIGIGEEDIGNIFTAFAQAQYNELNNCEGTGLGLSICHQLAEHMGGKVNVKSAIGLGSTFLVEIPIEVSSEQSQVFDKIKEFSTLKVIAYTQNDVRTEKYESFFRYTTIFGLNVEMSRSLVSDFDVALFIHEDVDEEFKEKVIASDKKYIALMSKPCDDYEEYPNITSLCFPLYSSKIINTFSELIHPEIICPYIRKVSKKFIGHILVAEDNEANQELIKILLLKYGLSFDLVANGLEAVNLYQANKYDLIIMDEQMPLMDGNEAVKEILQYEKVKGLKHTPVSALTANVIKGAKERGLRSGFDSFLGKPIVLKELERVFLMYLKVDKRAQQMGLYADKKVENKIDGLNIQKLSDELMLSEDEVAMLLNLFINKMSKLFPELHKAIKTRDYKNIGLLSHNMKGASGNFRIELLQTASGEMEKMAKNKDNAYDYETCFEIIREKLEEISIN
ncbi:MAG: hybrid sensor histidine kinase/response regulator [Helicobacteraceae bacterium CG2_30_36_10]|nr:MAG: hybrid sensor histidine kinase/response regulator [Helicobacteraceae bacterium CG2_30_36_10]